MQNGNKDFGEPGGWGGESGGVGDRGDRGGGVGGGGLGGRGPCVAMTAFPIWVAASPRSAALDPRSGHPTWGTTLFFFINH